MARKSLSRTARMPSFETTSAYLRAGEGHLARALKTSVESDPVSALIAEAENRVEPLRPRTVRLYRQQYAAVIRHHGILGRLTDEQIQDAIDRVWIALDRIRGRPESPRTASKKVKDARADEARAVFGQLKLIAVKNKNMIAAAAALYCLVAPRIGPRPVELSSAKVVGTILRFKNAKKTSRHPDTRDLDLSEFEAPFLAATSMLIALAERGVAEMGYERWRNALAESLARACKASIDRRLSLYSFRHTAIATWQAAGYSEAEIAALAGHLGLATARLHYAGAKSGWKPGGPIAKPVETRPNEPGKAIDQEIPHQQPAFEIEAFPPADPRFLATYIDQLLPDILASRGLGQEWRRSLHPDAILAMGEW